MLQWGQCNEKASWSSTWQFSDMFCSLNCSHCIHFSMVTLFSHSLEKIAGHFSHFQQNSQQSYPRDAAVGLSLERFWMTIWYGFRCGKHLTRWVQWSPVVSICFIHGYCTFGHRLANQSNQERKTTQFLPKNLFFKQIKSVFFDEVRLKNSLQYIYICLQSSIFHTSFRLPQFRNPLEHIPQCACHGLAETTESR